MVSEELTEGESASGFDRRQVLKMVGGTAVAVTAMSGTASAHQSKFFGCERVCSDTDGDYAVVSVGDSYECRTIETGGPRDDVPWEWDAHCYEATDDEAVIGILKEDQVQGDERENEGCWLCLNPNACAQERYEDAEEVREALVGSTCGHCEGEVNISTECDPTVAPGTDDADDAATNESSASVEEYEGVHQQLLDMFSQFMPSFGQ